MAKVALIQREEKREKLVAKYAKKYAELKAIIDDSEQVGRRALPGSPGAAEAAAQCQPDPSAQPLRDHRSSAWHLPQVRSGAQQDS